jgi:heptose I phosphotransferase
MQYVNDEFKECVDPSNLFDSVANLEGEVYREVENRKTIRFECAGKGYFAKTHKGIGWLEVLKNLVQFRLPVLGASNEWFALKRLETIGIDTMTPVAYVSEGLNPARIQSCIVTRELEGTISLEDLWAETQVSISLKRKLIDKLGATSKKLHGNGVNHRDYYICHYLLDQKTLLEASPTIYLIDLHRAQLRETTPVRWKIKDIGGLFFSSFNIGLTKRDVFRFMKSYSGKSLRETLVEDKVFWQGVLTRAKRLYLQDEVALPEWITCSFL